MTLDQALSYIHSVTWRGSVPGLSRTRELLSKMGDPQNRLKFIHVAGTNGKGSTCAMLSSILQKAGYDLDEMLSIAHKLCEEKKHIYSPATMEKMYQGVENHFPDASPDLPDCLRVV